MYFKDLDLVKAVAKTPEIRRLLTYKEEIKFFDNSGIEVSIVRGQVFIEMLPTGNKVKY